MVYSFSHDQIDEEFTMEEWKRWEKKNNNNNNKKWEHSTIEILLLKLILINKYVEPIWYKHIQRCICYTSDIQFTRNEFRLLKIVSFLFVDLLFFLLLLLFLKNQKCI